LFEALREWRRNAAEAAEMPPNIVFSDRTLVAIATTRPTTRGLLARVSGVGPKKLEEYGDAVLAVVRDHS
jgi:superfamily II DNA helicase RecQ